MEPVDYVKIAKAHWKLIAVLAVAAMGLMFAVSPATPTETYEAEHVLQLVRRADSGEGGSSAVGNSNVATVAMLVETPDLAQLVAEELGYTGDPLDLSGKVMAVADSDQNTITITAEASNAEDAKNLANTFGEQLVAHVDKLEEESVQERLTGLEGLQGEVTSLQEQYNANPTNRFIESQLTQKTEELTTAQAAAQSKAEYGAVAYATTAQSGGAFISNLGRIPRTVLAGLVAVIVAFGLSMILDRSDDKLRTKDQAERAFALPVLAEVPMLMMRDRARAAVVSFERDPRVAEAYRGLRTGLLLFRGRMRDKSSAANGNGDSRPTGDGSDKEPVRQLVVVTSPEAGDGKSTSAANMAMAYAESGQSVLLISWDLWRPLSPAVFDAEEGPGVADYLNGMDTSLVRYVQDTSIPGVRIVTAGLGGQHAYTQIDNARRLLEEARSLANVVIVDTAPILSASVTRELCTMADAVVVVARAGRTTTVAADRCSELLERLGAPTLGVVLVGVATGRFSDYYGAPPRDSRPPGRSGYRRSEESAARGPRHKAQSKAQLRPTSAQYRASTQSEDPYE